MQRLSSHKHAPASARAHAGRLKCLVCLSVFQVGGDQSRGSDDCGKDLQARHCQQPHSSAVSPVPRAPAPSHRPEAGHAGGVDRAQQCTHRHRRVVDNLAATIVRYESNARRKLRDGSLMASVRGRQWWARAERTNDIPRGRRMAPTMRKNGDTPLAVQPSAR